jgi:hypothetical protein
VPRPKLIEDPDHHFVKHCKKRELIRENGTIIGVFPEAFRLRPKDANNTEEKWLSGQYLEFYDGTDRERLCACCHFIPLEMKRSDALCRMKVGEIREAGSKRSKSLRTFHQGVGDSPGYAAIHGLPKASDPIDDELLSLLAILAQSDLVTIENAL